MYYLVGIPAPGEVDIVLEEASLARLCHLVLQGLQEVREPLKRVCVRADPVEIHLAKLERVVILLVIFIPDMLQD